MYPDFKGTLIKADGLSETKRQFFKYLFTGKKINKISFHQDLNKLEVILVLKLVSKSYSL